MHRLSNGFCEERAVVIMGEKRRRPYIIDINGNIYGNLDFYRARWNFSEGLLPAETTDGRTGYVNKDGEFAFLVPIVADIPEYDESPLDATDFKDGYAIIRTVHTPSIWQVINNKGEFISDEIELITAGAFCNGLSLIRTTDDKYGYINTKGEFVIEPVFDYADYFHNGYARIIYQGRDGLINTEGTIFWCDEIVNNSQN